MGCDFQDKEVEDTAILLANSTTGHRFHFFCFKKPNYVMKVMLSWMTLEELEGGKIHRIYNSTLSGEPVIKRFKYRQPFGLHFG